ncbi:hypothetical protein THF1A12_1060004 [Vibrio jasicida]|uniref:Dinitrogenase iron-molybdenum cofactor biosynthesis domain-containing protein n=1 Tax=Vibrio jasicida TaxID=766224 RepID=A0AAU9QFD0_9VIBR|nr:hypothetical protein THF1A12_1060004 [Vibrio jasicida]
MIEAFLVHPEQDGRPRKAEGDQQPKQPCHGINDDGRPSGGEVVELIKNGVECVVIGGKSGVAKKE